MGYGVLMPKFMQSNVGLKLDPAGRFGVAMFLAAPAEQNPPLRTLSFGNTNTVLCCLPGMPEFMYD